MGLRFRMMSVGALVVASMVTVGQPDGFLQSGQSGKTMRSLASRRGRPRKFNRPAKAVTLTLPEDTIAALRTIDRDISRAVVRAVEPLASDTPRPSAELATFGNRGVIIVAPTRAIGERTGAELVPLPDGRALVAFGDDLTASKFELRLQDALADHTLDAHDRETFESLVGILRESRQRTGADIPGRTIMVLDA